MSIRKFTRTESAPEVVSPEAHQAIEDELNKLSRTSARGLSDEQRDQLRLAVDKSDSDR